MATERYTALPFAGFLRSEVDEEKAMGLSQLSELTDTLEGEQSWELCAQLREESMAPSNLR